MYVTGGRSDLIEVRLPWAASAELVEMLDDLERQAGSPGAFRMLHPDLYEARAILVRTLEDDAR